MEIKSIKNFMSRNFGNILATSVVLASGAGIAGVSRLAKSDMEYFKSEIQAKDPERYIRTLEGDNSISRISGVQYWGEAYNRMQDSLRTDSIVKKAYFEGAQMVRDSIANTNLK